MPLGVAGWVAVAGTAATLYSADQQSDAAEDAANTQRAGADAATAEQRAAREQARADTAPYRESGYRALSKLDELLGLSGGAESGALTKPFTGANLTSDPGYQFGLKQGQETLQNSLAARGGLYSGAAGRALTRYGQDYAGTKFNEAFNRDLQTRQLRGNQLAGISGTGQTSISQLNTLGAGTANAIGQNAIGGADAQAAAQIARGSTYGNAFNQIAGQGINYLRRPQTSTAGGYDLYDAGVTNNSGSPANFNFTDPSYYGSGGFA